MVGVRSEGTEFDSACLAVLQIFLRHYNCLESIEACHCSRKRIVSGAYQGNARSGRFSHENPALFWAVIHASALSPAVIVGSPLSSPANRLQLDFAGVYLDDAC